MARINAYARTDNIDNNDVFIIDSTIGSSGTRTVLWSVFKKFFAAQSHTHTGSDIVSAVGQAIKAEKDLNGVPLKSYIKSIRISGTTVTITQGDGTITKLTTQDTNTTYSAATTISDGLMSAQDKINLEGLLNDPEKSAIISIAYSDDGSEKHGYDVKFASGRTDHYPIPLATTNINGLMGKNDKEKLDSLVASANGIVAITNDEIDEMI